MNINLTINKKLFKELKRENKLGSFSNFSRENFWPQNLYNRKFSHSSSHAYLNILKLFLLNYLHSHTNHLIEGFGKIVGIRGFKLYFGIL